MTKLAEKWDNVSVIVSFCLIDMSGFKGGHQNGVICDFYVIFCGIVRQKLNNEMDGPVIRHHLSIQFNTGTWCGCQTCSANICSKCIWRVSKSE